MSFKKSDSCLLFFALIGSVMLAACSGGARLSGDKSPVRDSDSYQQQISAIRQQIKAPKFPEKDFLATSFGAKGNGSTINSEAFRKAIDACSKNGGGRVVVPEGTFITGAIYLQSNVNLHLTENAIIRFVFDTTQYPLVFTRWEGMELMNYSPFIYAYGEKNIAITGKGILDGGATNDTWWKWNGNKKFGWKEGMPKQTPDRDLLQQQNNTKVAPRKRVYGAGHYLRPQFVQPYNCTNILIEGVKLINSPMWNLNPVLCENVTIRDVRIETLGPNNDGCDPESCKNVLISNCYFDTGDDCIAIKSGRNEDGRRIGRPSENIIIENCTMKNGHGGVVIGSEISGGAKNIYALNNVMSSPDLDRVLRIKTSSQRGGVIENVYLKDVRVGTYKESAVHVNMFYEEPGQHLPVVRNIHVENMVVEDGGKYGVYIKAYEQSPVQNLTMINCTINGVEIPVQMDHVKEVAFNNVTINGTGYSQNIVQAKKVGKLKVSTNKRYLVTEDNNPFFWLGDTGWLLFAKLNREEAEKYLADRSAKGFNVIQVMGLHKVDVTNVYGDTALVNNNVAQPRVTPGNSFTDPQQYDYWDHVDYIIDLAATKGIYMAIVPVWGTNVKSGKVNLEDAKVYAAWIANRYKNKPNIVWLNGGDIKGSDSMRTWKAIGETIKENDPSHLMTFHPRGRTTSSDWFHNEKWLDFNMFQSGHRRYDQDTTMGEPYHFGEDNWRYVALDYNKQPIKPTLDGEPSYEQIPQGLHNPANPYWQDRDIRRYAYWSVFAGGAGFTYGHNSVIQFHKPSDKSLSYGSKFFWYDAINHPGAQQMKHLKNLMLSRSFGEGTPDQSFIINNDVKYQYLAGYRGKDYALIYTYTGRNISVDKSRLQGMKVGKATWYNPRDGSVSTMPLPAGNIVELNPPGEPAEGNDWVLILES